MSRIRTIKPDYWTSEQVVECSRDARLLFIGMWNFADDQGVLPNNAKAIKMRIFPGDEDINSESVRRMIDELLTNRLLLSFEAEGIEYLHITGWKHQKVDKPSVKYPAPPAPEKLAPRQSFDDHSSNSRRTLDDHSPPEGKGSSKSSDSSVSNETYESAPAVADDPVRMFFDTGVQLLGERGMSAKAARSLLGKMRQGCRDNIPRAQAILDEFAVARPAEPAAWLMARAKPFEVVNGGQTDRYNPKADPIYQDVRL